MKRSNPVLEKKTKIRPFILMPPLSVFDMVVNIHERVTFYLESSFYNLTTIALHDWLTYSEMKNLAKEKVRTGWDLLHSSPNSLTHFCLPFLLLVAVRPRAR